MMKTICKCAAVMILFSGIFSCSKLTGPDRNQYWWIRKHFSPSGIQSIEYVYLDDNGGVSGTSFVLFNEDGSFASETGQGYEISYTYNPDGSLSKYTVVNTVQNYTHSSSALFEYNRSGRFVPHGLLYDQAGNGTLSSFSNGGLMYNLSRITEDDTILGHVEIDYSFSGEMMTMTTTGGRFGPFDPVTVEFRGAYPYQYQDKDHFWGPITYQQDGMFASFREGTLRDGEVDLERTYYFEKGPNDSMLLVKVVEEFRNHHYVQWNTYNAFGDCIETVYESDREIVGIDTAEYEYDSRGNWIKKVSNSHINPTMVTLRNIEYY